MNVVEFLASLAKLDIRLWLEGDNLRFSAPEGAFTPAIRDQVVARKPEIIDFLRQARKLNEAPIPVVSREGNLPVSFSQQRLWLLDQLNPRDVTYNMSSALRIRGELKLNVLEKVFATLVQRHESLRTRFINSEGEPFQVVDSFGGWQLPLLDLRDLAEDERERRVTAEVQQESLTPYDLADGPLFRARLLQLADQDHVLIAGMHHIISDAWSMDVLVKEISTLYMAFSAGISSPLPPLPIQYADYAAWQRQQMSAEEMEKHQQYWVKTLSGAPPVLDIPTDRPREDIPSSNGALFDRKLDGKLGAAIAQACGRHDITPYMFFLGAWQLLLGRYADSRDVVIGAPVAGRSRSETQELIGFFVNVLLFRLDLSGNPTATELYARVKEMVLGGFSHQDMPIDRLLEVMDVDRQPGYPPLAQSMFQLINISEQSQSSPLGQSALSIEPVPSVHVSARMDLAVGIAKTGDQYAISVEYNTDLFNESTVANMVDLYVFLLGELADKPEQCIDAIELHDAHQLLQHMGFEPSIHELIPLNTNQQSLYLDELTNAGTAQNAYGNYVELKHRPDLDKLTQAIQSIVDESGLLRSVLSSCDVPTADIAYLVSRQHFHIQVKLHDWSADEMRDNELEEHILKLMHRPYRLPQEELISYHLVNGGNNRRFLVVACHHILLDGASTYLLMQNILLRYNLLLQGHGAVFAEYQENVLAFLRWDRENMDTEATQAFWHDQLRDVEALHFTKPAETPFAQPVSVFNDRLVTHTLDRRQYDTIREYCSAHGINPPLYFRALFGMALQHYCRPDSAFAFSEFYANRAEGWGNSLGCFYQQFPTVIEKNLLSANATIVDWYASLKKYRDGVRNHRALSLSWQNRNLPRGRNIFMFNYYNFVTQVDVAGQTLTPFMSAPKVDGAVQFIVKEEQQGITLELRYDATRFDDLYFLQRIAHINEQILFGDHERVSQLQFLSAGELNRLYQWSGEVRDASRDDIVAGLHRQLGKTPDNTAVIAAGCELSYRQLHERSNRLAHWLKGQGVGANVRVGICLDRSVDLVVAVLAVLKAGGAYVPMDPTYPRERLVFMLADSAAPVVISRSEFAAVLDSAQTQIALLDQMEDILMQQSAAVPDTVIDPDDQIYVIYTSGSTGQPKGAMVCHRGETNLQDWYLDALGVTAQDRTLLVSAVGFDLTQKNLFAPLLAGAALVLPSMELFDENELLQLIEKHRITWVNCAPSAFYPLVEASAANGYRALQSLRYVVLGGEPIRLSALYSWLSTQDCKAQLINSYGPTECTDVVAWHKLERISGADQSLPIGRPVGNMQIFILNDHLQQVVPGLVGEICVAGVGVGLGYINRDELTESVFIDNPYGTGKLYRTGDLGRFLPNGDIDYIGRKDFQIKLRGLRIELGEIEHALKQLPGVLDGLALVRDDKLIAYVVADQGQLADDWRPRLRDYLPEYMIPALVVPLEAWPLTPNGKVDRKALPDPAAILAQTSVYVAPRNELEQQLANIWQELLEKDQVGVLDSLFDLGGNSLVATRILSRVKKQFNVQVSVRELFVAPTVADLAVAVNRARQTENIPPITAVDHGIPQPLSFAQQRLWFLDQLDPGNMAYNMPGAFRVSGRLNVDVFEKALQAIVLRHAVLRSQVILVNDQPCQLIGDGADWRLQRRDFTRLSDEQREPALRERVQQWREHAFNLEQGPLFLVELISLGVDDYVLLVNMHHIVSDGWSNGILMRELGMFYDAFLHQRPAPLTPLKIQYVDFAQWQRKWLSGDELERQVGYWRDQLAGVEVLNLPTDRPRRADSGFAGNILHFSIDTNLAARLNQLSRQQGASLYMTMLAAYMVLLAKYSNQEDISVGSPIANRNQEDIEGLIGFFVNTLVLRGNVASGLSFSELVQQIRQQTLDAYSHQDVPFERLVDELVSERDMLHTPLFQVMFSLQNVPMDANFSLPGIKINGIANQDTIAKFDLDFSLMELDGEIKGEVVYRTALYEQRFVQRLIDHYIAILKAVCAEPEASIGAISVLTPAEVQRLHAWNNTARHYDRSITVHSLFEQQVDKTPDLPALICGDARLSYRELEQQANRYARLLQEKGVRSGDVVGLCLPRSIDLMVALMGTLKAGATYLPLDPSYPVERLQYMIEDAEIRVLVARSDLDSTVISMAKKVVVADRIDDDLQRYSPERLPEQGSADNLLYVIYTSGSTGKPKGTGGFHRSEVNLQNWYCRDFGINTDDRVLLISAIGFDLTQKNLFAPLISGAALVIPTSHDYDPADLIRQIEQHKVTWINCAPNAFYPVVEEAEDLQQLQSLRWIFLGGEPIDFDRLRHWLGHSRARLVNSYGPTECTDIATIHVVNDVDAYQGSSIPIGRPIDNVRVYILDEQRRMVPEGVPGELCIGGDGVGPGYLRDAEKTDDKFIPNPFAEGEKLYRTGDLTRYLPNGEIEYLGRMDTQVKIRGFRIEPGEIEAALRELDPVRACAVIAREDVPGRKELVAYVVLEQALASAEMRAHLKRQLPDFMVPSHYVVMDTLPLTPNGKVARTLLPAPQREDESERVLIAPVSETERTVLAIWQEVLGVDSISVDDDFFMIGGHSLLATQVMSRLRRTFRVNLALRALFEAPTIRNTATQIDLALASAQELQLPPVVAVDRNEKLPLSFVQQQLWLLDQLDPGTPAYNMPVALRITGELNVAEFERAFLRVIERHETLRTNFVSIDGEPCAVIRADAAWQFSQEDLSALEPLVRDEQVQKIAQAQTETGFDLAVDRLIRGTLIRLGRDENGQQQFVFVGAIHHMVSDGWSLNIMVSELMAFYQAALRGTDAQLPELDLHYVDIAAWQRNWLQGEVLERHVSFWREQLDNEHQVLNLPTDFPRPPVMTSNGAACHGEIAASVLDRAQKLAHEEGATLFMVLLATYQLLLSRYAGQERINVGSPIAGRDMVESENLVGFFINTVVMSTDMAGDLSFRTLLRRVREVALNAYAHQSLPFEKIIEELRPRRDTSRTPFFQVFLNLLNLPPQADSQSDLVIEPLQREDSHAHSKYDLNLYASETGDGLELLMVYNRDLFKAVTVERLLQDFSLLMANGLANPDRPVWQLSTLQAEDSARLPSLDQPIIKTGFHSPIERFLQLAQSQPDAQAVIDGGRTFSYSQLDVASARVRNWLLEQGVVENSYVAILAQRSADLIPALLGVLRAGGVFTVLDSAYPVERLSACLHILRPDAMLIAGDSNGQLFEALTPSLDEAGCARTAIVRELVESDADVRQPDHHDLQRRAYIAFTSGTSGEPKGIAGRFEPVAHFVDWYIREYQVDPTDRFSLLSGLAHDPLLRDIFVPLAAGACVVVPSPELVGNPNELLSWFSEQQISCAHLTPAMCRVLTASTFDHQLPALRLAGFGGDRLTLDTVAALQRFAPRVQAVNFYGATETPQVMAAYRVPVIEGDDEPRSPVPIGQGIEGVQVLVLDEHLQLCAPGQVGQIVIRTPYLSDGYINGPASTAFVVNPHHHDESDRLYLTGDKGRFGAEGLVEYLGRLDQQIKIRGFRIEPAEIQIAINALDFIAESVVVPGLDPRGEPCLVAYTVIKVEEEGWLDLLKAHLRRQLPDYMVPALIIPLERIPLTPNGKLNRAALPNPADHWQAREFVAPRSGFETEIAGIWQSVMKLDQISVTDNFFDIGGHSLLAVQIVTRVKEKYDVEFSMRRLFEVSSIAGMASYVENALWLREPQAGESDVEGDDFEELEI